WPRRISNVLLIVLPVFGVASYLGSAQVVDSDTAEGGVVVTGNGCPFQSNTVSSSTLTFSANGQATAAGPAVFAQADTEDDGPCPDDAVVPVPDADECPELSGSVSPSVAAYSANGQTTDAGPVMFAQADSEDDGPCPDDPVVPVP